MENIRQKMRHTCKFESHIDYQMRDDVIQKGMINLCVFSFGFNLHYMNSVVEKIICNTMSVGVV